MKHSFEMKMTGHEIDTAIIIEDRAARSEPFYRFLEKTAHRFALISDQTVAELYGWQMAAELNAKGIETHLITFPAGEKHKVRETKHALENQMLARELGRADGVIALGGGVTTDLAGFVAATYCRGMPWIAIPTTLMGMVDAAIGGKNGVNTAEGKNLIGSFYPPKGVFISPFYLKTLSKGEQLNGMAEIFKYGLIASKSLFDSIGLNQGHLEEWIIQSVEIKKMIVESDPTEQGIRRILNFGHTLGHALETASSFELPHGEAIALGMLGEAFLSFKLDKLALSILEHICAVFKKMGFKLHLPKLDRQQVRIALTFDKKSTHSIPRFVLLTGIGQIDPCHGNYCASADPLIIEEMLNWLFGEFS